MGGFHQQHHPERVDTDPGELDEGEGDKALGHQFHQQEIGGGHQVQEAGNEAHHYRRSKGHRHALDGFGQGRVDVRYAVQQGAQLNWNRVRI